VTALIYLIPLISKLQNSKFSLRIVEAELREPFNKRFKKAEFTACSLNMRDGRYFVDFSGKKSGSSAILTNMLGSTALLVTSEEDNSKAVGDRVRVVLLD
jgi:molybdopterin molybdotransferase